MTIKSKDEMAGPYQPGCVMKKLLMSVLAVLSASVVPAHAAVVINDESIEFSLAVFVSCANGGAGDTVILNGRLHILTTFTINGKRVSGKSHFQPQGISGVGLATGDEYRATGVTEDHFSASLNSGQFSQTFINNFRIVGQGPGNNFLLREAFHLTISANGEVTTTHDGFDVECK